MPVIVCSRFQHPFLPTVGSIQAIGAAHAARQDIRPLEIAIVNLMAEKETTERQLAFWLGSTPLQVNLTFFTTDSYIQGVRNGSYKPENTSPEHIAKFYKAFSEIRSEKFDGLIVTGVNAQKQRMEDEVFWPEIAEILDWSETNAFSSLFLCWGAKAALWRFHGIESRKGKKKLWGLYGHRLVSDRTGIVHGWPDRLDLPVSRWKSPDAAAVRSNPALEIVADSQDSGPNVLVEAAPFNGHGLFYPRRVHILCHPEYDADTLKKEYDRDFAKTAPQTVPHGYFPDDDPTHAPLNLWRHAGILYTNWINLIYRATPYAREKIPKPCR